MSIDPCPSNRQVVVLLSTMRAGSTLLKALLAEADDVSNLPEINFQQFRSRTRAWQQITALHPNRILLLKRPAWYHEVWSYPRLPEVAAIKALILVRDAYATIVSLRRMTFGKLAACMAPLVNGYMVQYWARVTERLGRLYDALGDEASIVRYEDLVAAPRETTRALFTFIGSRRTIGVASYREPENFQWQWGRDDGGPKIRSLRVQPPPPQRYADQTLLKAIRRSKRAQRVRARLTYPQLPGAPTRDV
jgi:Sulfotransferase family